MVHGNPAALTGDAIAARVARIGVPAVDPGNVRPLNAFERDHREYLPLVEVALGYLVEALSAPSLEAYAQRAEALLPKYANVLGTLHLLPTFQVHIQANAHDFWQGLLDAVEDVAGDEMAEDIEQSVAVMRRAVRVLVACGQLPVRPGTEDEDARLSREIGAYMTTHAWCTDGLFWVASTDRTIEAEIVASIPVDLAISARRAHALAAMLFELRRGDVEGDDD